MELIILFSLILAIFAMIYILLGVGRIWTYSKLQSEEAVKQTMLLQQIAGSKKIQQSESGNYI